MRVASMLIASVLSAMAALASPPAPTKGAAPAAKPEWASERSHWYQLRLDDKPCGWMHAEDFRSPDGAERRTVNESSVRFGRSGAEIEVSVKVVFDETAQGRPLRCEVTQRSGRDPIRQSYRFDAADRSKATVVSTQGGRTVESTVELPKHEWLTPLAAQAFAEARRRAGAAEFTLLTVDPSSSMKAAEVTAVRGDASKFAIDGREIPTVRWTVSNSLLRVSSVEEWSEDDVLVRSVSTLPIGRLESVLSDRATALGSTKGPAVELMVKTVVKPD
ncbi:MAG: hypothetical protein FJ253_08255, partial [Phycisphaerae bacterium]|nr:hypothetical protein [Phycisphaerae bacterium]